MHSFTFDGVNSRQYCKLFVSGGGTFNAPERDIESISVPGRNGDLTIDHGRYKNIEVEYDGWIAEDFENNSRRARAWLCSPTGYRRLEDDYHPDEFRMARFKDGLEFDMVNSWDLAGTTKVKFDCMPQRFLKSGEEVRLIDADSGLWTRDGDTISFEITNPTSFDALPYIHLREVHEGYHIGSFTLICTSGDRQTILEYNAGTANLTRYLYLDSATKSIYTSQGATTLVNHRVSGDYPIFFGNSDHSEDGGTTTVTLICPGLSERPTFRITPRWWIL